jgi:hypothetical protein
VSAWWLLLLVPSVLVVGAALGAYGIELFKRRDRLRRKDYADTWYLEPGAALPPHPPQPASPQVEMGRVRYAGNRPGSRRQLRGHRPK